MWRWIVPPLVAAGLLGCSFVAMRVPATPPPAGRECIVGPVVVDAIAVLPALLIGSVVSAVQHSDLPYPGTAASAAPYVPAALFTASAIYGFERHGRCLELQRREARDAATPATGSGSRWPAGGR